LYAEVEHRIRELTALNKASQALTSTLDLEAVLRLVIDEVRSLLDAEAASVLLHDPANAELVFAAIVGPATEKLRGTRMPDTAGLAGWVMREQQAVLVSEARTDTRFYDQIDAVTGLTTRSLLAVPLMARGTASGVLEAVNKAHDTFTRHDLEVLEAMASSAAIAIENARLFEAEHAGRQRLETLYRVGQAINSTLEANTILDRLTEEAMRATHASHGSAIVAHPDLGYFERRSLRGYSPELAKKAQAIPLPLDSGLNGRVYRTRQVLNVNDVRADPDYFPLIPDTRAELVAPILRGGQVLGNLDLQSPQVDGFRHVDLGFLQALTDQVAIALENARLFEETRRHTDELSVVSNVALIGASGRPFDETVARATDSLSRLWPNATNLGFVFVDEADQSLHMHASYRGVSPETIASLRTPLNQSITGWAAQHRQPIRVRDVLADQRYFAIGKNVRSEMAAPLMAGERAIGVVNVESPKLDAFSGEDLRLLTTLAGQLATIFEKSRLDAALVEHAAMLEQRVEERTVEVRSQQARTQAILDALGESVMVIQVGGIVQYVNPATETLTGYTAAEVIGQRARSWWDEQMPAQALSEMANVILTGRPWRGEIIGKRKEGALYHASATVAPIPGGSGEAPIAGYVGILRDITDRKRAETALRESEERYRMISELISDYAYAYEVERDGSFTTSWTTEDSFTRLTGYKTEEIGSTFKLYHPEDEPIAQQHVEETLQGRATHGEYRIITKNGETRWIHLRRQAVWDPKENRVIRFYGAAQDITERKRAEEEIRNALAKEKELSDLRSRFVTMTSHEFRTPLSTILSSAELLEHYGYNWREEKKLAHLRRIQSAVHNMIALLDGVLVIGKAEAGKLEFHPAPLELVQFCRDLVEEMQLMAGTQHEITFISQAECADGCMDEKLLRQILSNVLSNALKYSPPGKPVRFELDCQEEEATFRIRDQGIGIPEQDQRQLFEAFHRAGNVGNVPGTGLGLTIVKKSVDLQGGTIVVASQINVGTTVTIVLPLTQSAQKENP
jgi:PAS domain S-box-containing protein